MQKLFGIHALESALNTGKNNISRIYVLQNNKNARLQKLIKQAAELGISTKFISRNKLDKISDNNTHQGVIAETISLGSKASLDLDDLADDVSLLLILDQVQDPHNLGACLRSADAFAADAVIAPKSNSASITPVAAKVACGAAETVPFIQVSNLASCLEKLKQQGFWLVGLTDAKDEELKNIDLTDKVAIVMGAEGSGMRQLTMQHCDFLAKIPMLGSVSSLNVSVATGVALYEAQRQRCAIT